MKIDWNKKDNTKLAYWMIGFCLSIVFARIVFYSDAFTSAMSEFVSIFHPFIIGGIIAYLLNFILKFYEHNIYNIFKKINSESKFNKNNLRNICIILTYITASFILYGFTCVVLPQLVESIKGLTNDIPMYIDNTSKFLNDILIKIDIDQDVYTLAIDKWNHIVNYIVGLGTSMLPIIGQFLKTTASGLWNIILGLIISIYFLLDKNKFKALANKIIFALFSKKHSDRIIELANRSNQIFGKFISGKIIDSIIIGILTFIVLTLTKMPYTTLISVIIGVTNIIPFFGPFFGAIPSILIILFVSPIKALWFLLIIIIIQQIDGNIIGPKILGDSIGISAFWVLFALLVAGKLFGVVGMIVGVPAFAVIYSVIKEIIEIRLDEKGLPTDTDCYLGEKA